MTPFSQWYDSWTRSPWRVQSLRKIRSFCLNSSYLPTIRSRWLALATLTLLLAIALPGLAQDALPQDIVNQKPDQKPAVSVKSPVVSTLESLAPPNVQSLLTGTSTSVSTAPVRLDGRTLFLVAAPTVEQASDQDFYLSAQQRAQEIERRLYEIIRESADPDHIEVQQDFDTQSNQPIIKVNDQFLATVTSLDAQIQGYSNPSLKAQDMVEEVEAGLQTYYQERQPQYLWQQLQWALVIAGIFAVLFLGFGYGQSRLRRQKSRLQADFAATEAELLSAPSRDPNTALRARLQERAREGWNDLKRVILRIGQWASLLLGAYLIFGLFPYSRWLQLVMQRLMQLPLELGLLILITYWLIRLSSVLVDRLFLTLQDGAIHAPEPSQRLGLRFSTFSQVLKSLLFFFICLTATIVGLSILGVRIGPLLTGAGLVGLAVSLASQNLIQDFINGFLILLEDQYGVGDVIVVGDVWGFVETMNLRMTQLRNEEGRLITIPNSKIDIVQNLSKEWARVDLMIPIALSSDINAALALIERVASDMRKDAIWGQLILEPPLLLGVDQLDHAGATVRIWIKTQPLKQWDVAREYRRRLKIAFEEASIDIGIPQQVVHFNGKGHNSSHGISFAAPASLSS